MLIGCCVPMLLVYMAYYWAGMGGNGGDGDHAVFTADVCVVRGWGNVGGVAGVYGR